VLKPFRGDSWSDWDGVWELTIGCTSNNRDNWGNGIRLPSAYYTVVVPVNTAVLTREPQEKEKGSLVGERYSLNQHCGVQGQDISLKSFAVQDTNNS